MNNYCMIQNSKTFAFSAENPPVYAQVVPRAVTALSFVRP